MARCIRVLKSHAEEARQAALAAGVLDLSYRIGSDGGFILIPVTSDLAGFEMCDAELRSQERVVSDYRDVVSGVPEGLRDLLPSSFDMVGDIAIMKIPDELRPYSASIGDALLKVVPNIRAVFHDEGVKGEFRVRDLTRIAGTGDAEVVHRENGVRLKTDPSKVFFNPRLSAERARVAGCVKDGEVVIDMFAGVAPFGCVICRNASPSMVYSIDLNPECQHFAEENVRLNKIRNLKPITGDATVVVKSLPKADRVIMNLPQIADRFLPDALGCVKPSGVIHMHRVLERSEVEDYSENLVKIMASAGSPIRIVSCIELKNYSPTKGVYVFDIMPAASRRSGLRVLDSTFR